MPHYLYKRDGTESWWINVKIKGRRRIRRSAGTADKNIAEAIASRIEAAEWGRLIHGDPASLTFAEAVMMYVEDGHAQTHLAPLVRYFRDEKVAAIKAGHIRAAGRVIYPNAKPATWNRQVITPTRAVINHAAAKELAAFIKVKLFPDLRAVRTIPDVDWLPRFLRAAPPQLGALALFMRITGARVGQAIAVDWTAIDLSSATVIIPAAKKHPARRAEITPQMVAMLANLPGSRHGRVFGYEHRWAVYGPWRASCKAAGIPYVTTHPAGRRSFATAMARAKVDAKTASIRGGRKSVRLMLDIYTEANAADGLIAEVFGTFESQDEGKKS